jgi:hypothetical protein
MLILSIFIVNYTYDRSGMKHLLFSALIFISSTIAAQNTRIVFTDVPVSRSNFDGDQITNYATQGTKKGQDEAVRHFEKYHSNGQLAEEGLIVNNRPDGTWKKFDNKGKLIAKTKYRDGQKMGKWIIWNFDGSVLAKGRYNKDGNKTGNWIYWSSIDQKYIEKSF